MKALLAAVVALAGTTAVHAGIPVVGGPVNLAYEIERAMTSPEVARIYPELAAAYAESVRQREADAYNRKKAEDLRRAQAGPPRTDARPVQATPAATAGTSPQAQAVTQVRPVAVPGPTPTNQPQGE